MITDGDDAYFSFIVQGSAKLEKAEILQMTVEHLRHLHTRDPRGKAQSHLPPFPIFSPSPPLPTLAFDQKA